MYTRKKHIRQGMLFGYTEYREERTCNDHGESLLQGSNGSARAFVAEMEASGIAAEIRKEPGNLRYQYFQPLDDPETVLLIDSWADQAAIDAHHASPMMARLAALREKYDLHMTAERFVSEDLGSDDRFIRK